MSLMHPIVLSEMQREGWQMSSPGPAWCCYKCSVGTEMDGLQAGQGAAYGTSVACYFPLGCQLLPLGCCDGYYLRTSYLWSTLPKPSWGLELLYRLCVWPIAEIFYFFCSIASSDDLEPTCLALKVVFKHFGRTQCLVSVNDEAGLISWG